MDKLYRELSFKSSELITKLYSTSFSIGVRSLAPSLREAVYSIYGFVRLADEIVDSFHEFDKKRLIEKFEDEYYSALENGISLNPVINAFQITVREYSIPDDLIQSFLKSMKFDLMKSEYSKEGIKEYIYGSADVVGLMCLKVFTQGNDPLYNTLKPYAMRLGSAFQKVNFLRDIKADSLELSRNYFPQLNNSTLNDINKIEIIRDIKEDFREALKGIKMLPSGAAPGVYIAYTYYRALTKKIKHLKASQLFEKRVRIANFRKFILYIYARLIFKIIKK